MSRHNRRRTRGGHRNNKPGSLRSSSSFESSAFQSSVEPPLEALHFSPVHPTAPCSANSFSLRQWPAHHVAWQTRARRPVEASAALEAVRRRFFGEADGTGEDEGLCVKMLEYFGGLDFIDG